MLLRSILPQIGFYFKKFRASSSKIRNEAPVGGLRLLRKALKVV